MGSVEKETRVKGLCNVVLSQRAAEISPKTGKPKQHHTTRAALTRAVAGAVTVAATYTADVAERAKRVAKRKVEDPLVAQQKAAQHSCPDRRAAYEPKTTGFALVVPRGGSFLK